MCLHVMLTLDMSIRPLGRLDIQMSNGYFDMSIRPLDEWTYPNVRWTFRYVHLSTG